MVLIWTLFTQFSCIKQQPPLTFSEMKDISFAAILDDGDSNCLPVVTAMLNPACKFNYNDIDLQNALSQYHWYVSGYQMSYEDPFSKKSKPIFTDYPINQTMFRIVIKANINESMVHHLIGCFDEAFKTLDQISKSPETRLASTLLRPGNQIITKHC